MPDSITISLRNLSFFAYHGLYKEEQKTGNEFEINLSVSFPPAGEIIRNLEDSINYAALYEMVRKAMQTTSPLLETIVMELADNIQKAYPVVNKIDISIVKKNPPIEGITGDVAVNFTKIY
jgi:dihydroneopterin aldolase